MGDGIPLWQGGNDSFRDWPHEQGDATHIAYPADVARARDAVVEAARASYDDLLLADGEGMDREAWTDLAGERLERALKALDAAEGGA